ncbi:MAG TPA: hypothetical protein VFL42_10760, partial [Terriglobales bacterium]|nr:hypothetical protein [Terriglobales bacterium]
MKTALAALFAFSMSLNLAAQRQTASVALAAAPAAASTAHVNLVSTLNDMENTASSTNTDLGNLHVEKWPAGWKTGFMKKSSHKKSAEQMADSLKQSTGSLPAMIAQVRSSHGSLGSTFKLYNHLTQVCEGMDPLVEATQAYGKKEDFNRLNADHTNLVNARNTLASYLAQRADLVDPKGDSGFAGPVSASAKKPEAPAHS